MLTSKFYLEGTPLGHRRLRAQDDLLATMAERLPSGDVGEALGGEGELGLERAVPGSEGANAEEREREAGGEGCPVILVL